MAVRGPAALRPIVMALHWSAAIMVVGWLAGAFPAPVLAAHAAAWAIVTVIWGMRGTPSPALPRPVAVAAHYGQLALLALYVLGAALAIGGVPGARLLLLLTLAVGALHGTFNLWRAMVLGDGALRRMLPKALH